MKTFSYKKKVWITGGGGMVGRNLIENKANENYSLLYPNSKELDLTKLMI